jgi:cytochrome P450
MAETKIDYVPGDPDITTCPWPYYTRMRHDEPVYKVPDRSDYFVSRYADVVYVLDHPGTFSNKRDWKNLQDPDLQVLYKQMPCPIEGTLADEDEPRHGVFHKFAMAAFTPKRLREKEASIRALIDGVIDGFIDRGEIDFVAEFANEVPSRVVATILGLPPDRARDYRRWFDAGIRLSAAYSSKEQQLEYLRTVIEYYQFMAAEVDTRIASPTDDVISEWLTGERADGQKLDRTGVINLIRQMLGAGQDSSAMTMGIMMRLLIENPTQMARAREEPGYLKKVVEETLRVEHPIQWQWRFALEDTELAGVRIPKGARLLTSWASANRDERKWHQPERFDPNRTDLKDHMGFGKGLHYCIGAPLARLEIAIAFERLLGRLDNIGFAQPEPEFTYPPNPQFRALSELRIRFRPAGDS